MQFFDENYNLTDTTTSPILLEDVVEGTPVYEGQTTGGVKVQEGENKVYQENIAYITDDAGKKESDEMFNLLYKVQTKYGSKKNEDGSAFIQWSDAQGNPITFNSLDEWNKLSSSTKFQLLESYDKLVREGHPFIYLDDKQAGSNEPSYYDLTIARSNVANASLNVKTVSKIHGGYMKEAAARADGSQKEQLNLDRFSYHQAMLDENGTPISEAKYNAIVNNRYNSLISQSALIRSAVPYNFYRNQLLLEQSSPGYKSNITLKDTDSQAFNEAILNSETVFDLMNNLPKDQLGKFSNKFGYHFGLLESQDPYINNCQSPECRELRNRSNSEYSRFIEENDLKIKTGTDEKTGKPILREPRYEELWNGLKEGKERQTYANTYSQIIQAYNDPALSKNISKLKDRYQYVIDAGLANVQRDVPIKYDFDIDDYKHKNYTTLGNIFGLLKNTYEKDTNALNEKGYKFAFGVNSNDMQNIGVDDKTTIADNEETLIFNADDETTQGKYLKQIIPYMTDLIKDDKSKGTIEYREFLSKEDMGDYEVYTVKFNPKFLDNEEFNKVKFIESDEESTKIKNDIITKFKENDLTIYVPKELAQRKLLPSIERKNAVTISPIEQALSDRGIYEINIPRAGNLKVVRDEAANLWRVTGNYLALNAQGKYDVESFNDSFEIKHDGKMKTPFDVDRLINARINNFRQYYNANTQIINNLNENGVNIGQDIYTYDGR